jgi:hypothetical protein
LLQIEKPVTDWSAGKTTFLKFKRGQANEPNGGQYYQPREIRTSSAEIVKEDLQNYFRLLSRSRISFMACTSNLSLSRQPSTIPTGLRQSAQG